jgi:hypothetical protein
MPQGLTVAVFSADSYVYAHFSLKALEKVRQHAAQQARGALDSFRPSNDTSYFHSKDVAGSYR